MVKIMSWPRFSVALPWAFPLGAVVVMVLLGVGLERAGIVKAFYASPFVLTVVLASIHSGLAGGYVAAIASALAFNALFAPPDGFHIPTPEEMVAYVTMIATAYVVGGYRQAPPSSSVGDDYSGSLPFASRRDNDNQSKRCWWDVEPTGSWREDDAVGREYGRIYLARLVRTSAPPLGWIVRDMIKSGRYTGIEAGFCAAVRPSLVETSVPHHNAADVKPD